jgi:hypothetical protein
MVESSIAPKGPKATETFAKKLVLSMQKMGEVHDDQRHR